MGLRSSCGRESLKRLIREGLVLMRGTGADLTVVAMKVL
jgi:hypothetical protein